MGVETEYHDIEIVERVASDSSKVASCLFSTSVGRSKNSEEDTSSGHQGVKFAQNSC